MINGKHFASRELQGSVVCSHFEVSVNWDHLKNMWDGSVLMLVIYNQSLDE